MAGAASVAAMGAADHGAFTRPASAEDAKFRARPAEDSGRGQRLAHGCRLAEGRRALPAADQGERQGGRVQRRRAQLHGAQQSEPAQSALPRLPEALGGLYRCKDHLDRPRPGRLQPAASAGHRQRHRRLRHPRDGRPLRGRCLRQGAGLGDARLGQEADRFRRLCELSEAAGRHLGRQDLSHHHRRRHP